MRKRDREQYINTERDEALETEWVATLTAGIEHQIISITRIHGLNTTSIKWDINRFGVVLKNAGLCHDFRSP